MPSQAQVTERHTVACWDSAFMDTHENIAGTEWDIPESVIEITADNLNSGGSTCRCSERREEFIAVGWEPWPLVDALTAARRAHIID